MRYVYYGHFNADGELDLDELQELHQAISAQLDEQHDVTLYISLIPSGETHFYDLAPAGESAWLSWLLLPMLHDLAQLVDTALYLTVDKHPRWIDINEQRVLTDVGFMLTEHVRRHYSYSMKEVEG